MHMLLLDRMFLLCKEVFVQCAAIRISYNPEIPNLRKRKNHTFFLETSICIIIRYTCSSSACGSLMMHSIFKAFWFVVWRPPKDNMLETWRFQGGHLMYIYKNNIGNCFRFFDAYHMYTKKYWAQEQPILCGFQICVLRFVCCLWLWKTKRNIYIYMMFMRFVKLKFTGEDVWNLVTQMSEILG